MNLRKLLCARQFKKLKRESKAHGIQIAAIWGGSDVELKCGKHRLKYSFTPFCKDPFRRALDQWFDGRADPYTLPLNCADIATVLSLPAEAVYTSRSLLYYGKKYTSHVSFSPSEAQEIIRRIRRGISGLEKRLSEMTEGDNYIALRPISGGGVLSRMAFPDLNCCSYTICRGSDLGAACKATEQFLKDNGFLADDVPLPEGRLMKTYAEIFRWENEQESNVVVDAIKTACNSVPSRIDEMRNRALRQCGAMIAQASTPRTENKLAGLLMSNPFFPTHTHADMASARLSSELQKAGERMEGYCLSEPTRLLHMRKGPTQRKIRIKNWSDCVIFKSRNSVPKWDEEGTTCSRKELRW